MTALMIFLFVLAVINFLTATMIFMRDEIPMWIAIAQSVGAAVALFFFVTMGNPA